MRFCWGIRAEGPALSTSTSSSLNLWAAVSVARLSQPRFSIGTIEPQLICPQFQNRSFETQAVTKRTSPHRLAWDR